MTFLVPTASMAKCLSGDESAREGSHGGVSRGWLVYRLEEKRGSRQHEGGRDSLGIPDLPLLLQTPKAVFSLRLPQRSSGAVEVRRDGKGASSTYSSTWALEVPMWL